MKLTASDYREAAANCSRRAEELRIEADKMQGLSAKLFDQAAEADKPVRGRPKKEEDQEEVPGE